MKWYQKRWLVIGLSLLLVAGAVLGYRYRFSILAFLKPRYSVEDRVLQYGPAAGKRLLNAVGGRAAYPPKGCVLLVDKAAKRCELFIPSTLSSFIHAQWVPVRTYPTLALSGVAGPKLREGDNQVPEGVYGVEFLNANSAFHLSLRLDYPNEFDKRQGKKDGREDLGTDIMVHGPGGSRGCVCLSEEAIEELFVLAAEVGKENMQVVIVPDEAAVLAIPVKVPAGAPAWTAGLYMQLGGVVKELRGIEK